MPRVVDAQRLPPRHGAARGALAVGPVVFCVWLRAASVQRAPVSCVSACPSVLRYSMRRRPGGRPVSSLPGSRLRLGRSPASRHSYLPSTTLSMHFSPIVKSHRTRQLSSFFCPPPNLAVSVALPPWRAARAPRARATCAGWKSSRGAPSVRPAAPLSCPLARGQSSEKLSSQVKFQTRGSTLYRRGGPI